jgi:hypothetical protein
MLDQFFLGFLNSKHEIPAFAEAASRRQAKFETISNDQNPKLKEEN